MWLGPSRRDWQEQKQHMRRINEELGALIRSVLKLQVGQKWLTWALVLCIGLVAAILGVVVTIIVRLTL